MAAEALRQRVFPVRRSAPRAAPAAALRAVRSRVDALDVARRGERHDDLIVGDQVFFAKLAHLRLDDLGAARITVLLAQLREVLLDERAHLADVGEDPLEACDAPIDLG